MIRFLISKHIELQSLTSPLEGIRSLIENQQKNTTISNPTYSDKI